MPAFRPLANLRVSLANPAPQYRRFSATPTRCLSAVFAETENPELNKILIDVQEKIILPAYLPETQRKIVYNPSKSDFMRRNPIVIELDGLEHTFSPIDIKKDIPNSKTALTQATKLMKTKEEWDNIATFLAGYKRAGIKLEKEHYSSLIRRACDAQQEYSIIECAKQADKTGLTLRYDSSITLLMSSINQRIYDSTREEQDILQALKWNQLIWDLIQRPQHERKEELISRLAHFSPTIRGLLLFSQAHTIQAQQAAGESVEKLTKELRDNVEFIAAACKIERHRGMVPSWHKLNVRSDKETRTKKDPLSPYYYVRVLAQNIRAVELAQEIIGDDAKNLTHFHDLLEKHAEDFIKAGSENRKGFGLEYERITGRKPDWEKYLTMD
ncbi:hypothetical protein FVEN_g8620 [Fusarium venenatum]|uniref:Uncharacterized protein n=2 Tax=Fusarium venenatum TaxID=56646 RepID=A0A2L2T0D7_9HYPO|nr:uncharacterized protein FVRRES_12084 [Fusarium venenatum]KAG8353365.1 hypothetical protein FVEN_g8620 [Fusarium venenatum]CEI39393.1 unnamed protein product [Fusarium venenatum]